MFYIVNLIEYRKNIIVPSTWIMNHELQMEKDMFHGVNPTQKILIYYDPNSYINGVPDMDKQPNFAIRNAEFPNEGCYKAKSLAFRSKHIILKLLFFLVFFSHSFWKKIHHFCIFCIL